jgi:hypothetical protein
LPTSGTIQTLGVAESATSMIVEIDAPTIFE